MAYCAPYIASTMLVVAVTLWGKIYSYTYMKGCHALATFEMLYAKLINLEGTNKITFK